MATHKITPVTSMPKNLASVVPLTPAVATNNAHEHLPNAVPSTEIGSNPTAASTAATSTTPAIATATTKTTTTTTTTGTHPSEIFTRRRSGSKILNLFSQDEEAGLDLDLDSYYKARALRESVRNLHMAFDRVQTTSVVESRGLRMALSPEEEFEYHQKLQRVTLSSPLDENEDDDGDDDDDEEEEDSSSSKSGEKSRASDGEVKSLRRSIGATGSSPQLSMREQAMSIHPAQASTRAIDDVGVHEGTGKLFKSKSKDKDRTDSKRLSARRVYAEGIKPFGMINPHGRTRLAWDLLSVLFIFFNAIVLPFRASFLDNRGNDTSFERALDFFFIFDILANFNTGIEVDGSVKYKRTLIARAYFRSWFIVDFIAAVPYGMFFSSSIGDSPSHVLNTLRLLRLVRLLRLFRISRIFQRIQNTVSLRSTMGYLIKYVCLVMFVAHWFSCVFHAIGQRKLAQHEPNWIDATRLRDPIGNVWDRYVAALYFSIMTLATIGYGDVSGRSADERLFSIFAMIIGGGIFAYGITNIVELVSSLTIQETRFREKMDEVNEYMRARELPMPLRVEIREFYYNKRSTTESKLNGEQQILNSLTSKLRSKIALSINDHFLRKFPFFEGSDPNFLMEVALNMRTIHFAPLEDVIVEGEIGNEMFFIFRGAVEILKQNKQIGIMGENQYFGELAILNQDNRRTATVRTLCFSELRMLSRTRFLTSLQRFPMMQKRLEQEAQGRGYQQTVGVAVSWRATGLDGAKSLATTDLKRPSLHRGTSVQMSRTEALMSEHEASIARTSSTVAARTRSRMLSSVPREPSMTNVVMAQGLNDTHRLTVEMQHKHDTMALRLRRLESTIDHLLSKL